MSIDAVVKITIVCLVPCFLLRYILARQVATSDK